MTDYREIIRLHSLKFSNVAIANSLCCSRNTVSEVLKLAETHSLEWPIPETLTNRDIGHLFYPDRGNNEGRRLPDYEYIYNELAAFCGAQRTLMRFRADAVRSITDALKRLL